MLFYAPNWPSLSADSQREMQGVFNRLQERDKILRDALQALNDQV
jgi:hypothetical protein